MPDEPPRKRAKSATFESTMAQAKIWHYELVHELADDAIQECMRSKPKDVRKCLELYIDAMCHAHPRVTGPDTAKLLLAASDHGNDHHIRGEVLCLRDQAYWALLADIWDEVNDRRIEWDRDYTEGDAS